MDFKEAQELLSVTRYVSKMDLKKRYIHLIKLHHPDVNADKTRANKLTAEINDAYQTILNFRERESWNDSDPTQRSQNFESGSTRSSKQKPEQQPQENSWENDNKNIPFGENPFWDSSQAFNYDLVPESFLFLEINTRFPSKEFLQQAYTCLIYKYHPSRNPSDPDAFEKCKNIHLAYLAAQAIRAHENWSSKATEDYENDSDNEYAELDSEYNPHQNSSNRYNPRQDSYRYRANRQSEYQTSPKLPKSEAPRKESSGGSGWWEIIFVLAFVGVLVFAKISNNVESESGQKSELKKLIIQREKEDHPSSKVEVLDIQFYDWKPLERSGESRKGYSIVKINHQVVRLEFTSELLWDHVAKGKNYTLKIEYYVDGLAQ